jgi:hypothetical protein
MTQHNVTICFRGGRLTEMIEAKHPLRHYGKNYPHAGGLDGVYPNRAAAERKLGLLRRAVAFMDRYDLIRCTHGQSSILALSLGRKPRLAEQQHDPLGYRPVDGWDHVTYWRRKSEPAPRVVITEPYGLGPRTLEAYAELAKRLDLTFYIDNKYGLWNPPDTIAVLWNRAGDLHWAQPQQAAMAA